MQSTGIVRRIDHLGRVVLPRELRRLAAIADRQPLEVYVDGDTIILRKYQPFCVFCGEGDALVRFRGKPICRSCVRDLASRQEAPAEIRRGRRVENQAR